MVLAWYLGMSISVVDPKIRCVAVSDRWCNVLTEGHVEEEVKEVSWFMG